MFDPRVNLETLVLLAVLVLMVLADSPERGVLLASPEARETRYPLSAGLENILLVNSSEKAARGCPVFYNSWQVVLVAF